jgi:hypothetical protein
LIGRGVVAIDVTDGHRTVRRQAIHSDSIAVIGVVEFRDQRTSDPDALIEVLDRNAARGEMKSWLIVRLANHGHPACGRQPDRVARHRSWVRRLDTPRQILLSSMALTVNAALVRPHSESPRVSWRLGYVVPASVRTGFSV